MANTANEVKTRINALLRERKVSENKLANGDPNLQGRLNGQLSHDVKLSVETVLLILEKFPDVSADWLLRGWEQLKPEPVQAAAASVGDGSIANNNNSTINANEAVRGLVRQLEEKDRQLEEKDKQLEEKDHQIGRLLGILERQQVG